MNMRWRKVLGDARQYSLQIGLMTLVLAIGVAGVVAALNARTVLKREIALSVGGAKLPDLALMFDRVTPELLAAVATEHDVVAVDSRRVVYTRVKAKDGAWLPMRLTVVRDFSAQLLGVVHIDRGAWARQDGVIFIEQSGQGIIDANVGGAVQIRTPSAQLVTLPVAAFVHDPAVAPSTQDRMIYAYVTPATAALMGQNAALDQLLVKMAYRALFADAAEFGRVLNVTLTRKGMAANRVDTLTINHPHAALMSAVVQVLGVAAAMAMICSSALAAYMVAAWMRREIVQVGIMKTLGANSLQIAWQYLSLVTPMVLLATMLGIIAGSLLGVELVQFNALSFNIDVQSSQVSPLLLLLEVVLALCVPLLAMAMPIVRAARMSAREAMQDAGIVTPSATATRAAAWLLKFPGSMRWTFALRNTWRRPWRLTVIVLALACAGALLLMNRTNYESMISVIDASLNNQGHDIEVFMQRWVAATELENIARRVPEVEIAEAWRRASVSLSNDGSDAAEAGRFMLSGYPEGTRLFTLPIVAGRAPTAATEVLMTRSLRDRYQTMQVGATVELHFSERRVKVRIVGMVEQIGQATLYTNFETFEAVTAIGALANAVRIKSRSANIEMVASAVDQAFLDAHVAPGQIISREMVRESLEEHFKVVGEVIRMVALAAALVGGIILAGTTGLNVLERTREIGIIRTIGATPGRIASIFIVEGAAVMLVSAALAIILSLMLSRAILNVAERTLLSVTVPMQFSMQGLAQLAAGAIMVMLMVVVTLAYALRKSVRESLSVA